MRKEYENIMSEVITEGEPLRDVIVLAPKGSEGNSQVLELIIEDRQVCVAFTNIINTTIFCVELALKGIDMSWCAPFTMESLPIDTGVWLDPSVKVLKEMSAIDFINRGN